jgi:hypothetical protein
MKGKKHSGSQDTHGHTNTDNKGVHKVQRYVSLNHCDLRSQEPPKHASDSGVSQSMVSALIGTAQQAASILSTFAF